MFFNIDLSSWRLVLELVLREDVSHCEALLLRTFLGLDLRPVRLVLVSVFRSSPGPSGQFQIAHQSQCSFRFTPLRLCVSVVLTLVTSVSIDTCHLCLLDAVVRQPCSLSLQLVSLRIESPGTSSQVSVALPRQPLYVVPCVLGYTTLLRKIRVVLGYIANLSLVCDLFMIDSLKLDDVLSALLLMAFGFCNPSGRWDEVLGP